jgi:cobalt-precorrin 5A hydrolase
LKTEHLPQSQHARVVLVGITKHGVQQLTAIAPELPDARILVSDKFAAQVQAFSERSTVYSGALRDQMQALFTDFDQIIFFVSLGAVVRLIAPLLRSKDEDRALLWWMMWDSS